MENFIESLYVPYQNKAAKAVIKDKIMIAVPMGTVSVPGLVTFNAEDFSVIGGKVFISSKRFDDKLDKVVSAATTGRVYAVSSSGENYMQPFSTTPGANRIPLRDSNGDVLVPAAPSSDNAAIGTTYADGRYVVKKPHTIGKTEVYIQTDNGVSTKEAGDTAGDIPVRNANGNITGHSPLTDDEYTTRSFVNSSIANEAADYISNNGEPFTSLAELNEYTKTHTVTNNDYAIIVVTEDNGNTRYDRYKYNESTGVWGFEYSINNSSFTEAQWAAINSGLTSAKLSTMLTEIDELMAQSLMSTDEIVAPYGESTVTYDTTDGITLHGALAVKTNDGDYWNIPLTFSLPLVVGDGLVADSTADNKKMTIKVDYEKTMKLPALDDGKYQMAVAAGKWNSGTSSTKPPDVIQWRGFQKGIKPNEIVQRTETGNVLLPDSFPTSPDDDGKDVYGNIISRMATPKGYTDANDWHVVDIGTEKGSITSAEVDEIIKYWPRVIVTAKENTVIVPKYYRYLPAYDASDDNISHYILSCVCETVLKVLEIRPNASPVGITWTEKSIADLQYTTNMTNVIGDSPSTTKYPSEKAVADYITANAGGKQVVVQVTTTEAMNTSWSSNPLSVTVSGTLTADDVTNLQKEGAIVDFSFSNITHLLLPRQYALEKSTSYLFFGGVVPLMSGTSGYPYSFYFRVSLSDNKYSLNYVPCARQTDVTFWISASETDMKKYIANNPFMKLIDFSALKDTENSQNLTMTITSSVFVDIINNLSNRYVKTGMVHDHEQILSPDNDNEFCLFWPNCLTYDENDSSQTTDAVAHFVGGHNGKFYEVQVSGSSASTGVWTNTKATLVELDAYLEKPENTGTIGQVLTKTDTGSQWVDSVTVQVVNIDSPAAATNGTLTAAQLATLQASDQNYIMFNHEKYYLGDKGHQEGFLTYSHVGYENGSHFLKSITITISTLAWVLNTTECADKSDIPSGGSSISWHTEAPSDTSKVLMTKCTCTACPDYEQFVGMTTLVYGYINTTSYSALAWQKVSIDPNSTNAVVFLGKFGPAAELGQYLEGPKYLSWNNGANGPDYTENTVAYEYLY